MSADEKITKANIEKYLEELAKVSFKPLTAFTRNSQMFHAKF